MEKNFTQQILEALRAGVELHGSAYRFARKAGVQLSSLGRWLDGTPPRLAAVEPAMDCLHAQIVLPGKAFFQHEFIPSGRARLTAEGTLSISEAPAAPWPFERSWLLQNAINQASSIMIEVEDAMMYPVLAKGDYALVDQADKMIKSGSIYLLSLGGELMFRKLVRSPNGLLIIAEAPGIPELPASMGGADYSGLTIHGRVRWASRLFD